MIKMSVCVTYRLTGSNLLMKELTHAKSFLAPFGAGHTGAPGLISLVITLFYTSPAEDQDKAKPHLAGTC